MRPYCGDRLATELDHTSNYSAFDAQLDAWTPRRSNMITKNVYLQGPVKWAKVFEFNRDKGKYAPEDGEYQISLGLSAKDFKIVKKWNRMYQGTEYTATGKKKKDFLPGDDKLTYITFKRKHKHFKADGETLIREWSGEPTVVAYDGEPWDTWNGGTTPLIGNGSVCTIKLDVTTTDAGHTFVRLEGVRVDEHVEFEGETKEPATEENHSDGIPF